MLQNSWATENPAQIQQACFISMACNFLRYIERMLDVHHGLRDEKVVRKDRRQLGKRQQKTFVKGRCLSPFMNAGWRLAKLSLQYVLRFRKHLFGESPPETNLPEFSEALLACLDERLGKDGRTAAYEGRIVTWTDLMKSTGRLEADLEGLDA